MFASPFNQPSVLSTSQQTNGGKAVVAITSDKRMLDQSGETIGKTVQVNASRPLTAQDNGRNLEVTAAGVNLTLPKGLLDFGCTITTNNHGPTVTPAADVQINAGIVAVTITSPMGAIVAKPTADRYTAIGV